MLTIKMQGITIGELRTSPYTEIMHLFCKYQNETSEDVLHNMGRVLALASDLHAVLQGTSLDYAVGFINRHYTLSVYKADEFGGISLSEYADKMHPLEVVRISETEQGR